MKSPTSFLIKTVTITGVLFLFACERAVDKKTTLTLSLPSSQSVKRFSSNLTALNLGALAGPGPTGIADSVDGDFAPEPPGIPSEYESLCYMVTITYPDKDAPNRNFCGVRNTASLAAGTGENDISQAFMFSQNFLGLIGDDPAVSGSIELSDVLVGSDRKITVIGIPTTDQALCQNILSQPISKSSMLRPRIIGSTTQEIKVGDNDVAISINSSQPSAIFDDCVITDTKLSYPHAEKMEIDQDNFPFNYMRGFAGESRGYVCQPLVLSLKASSATTGRDVAGALNFDGTVAVNKYVNGTLSGPVTSYNSHENCYTDTAGTGGNRQFQIGRNQHQKKRWVQIKEVPGDVIRFAPALIDPTPEITTFVNADFKVGSSSTYIFDYNMPRVLQLDTCYKVSTTIRNLNGIAAPAGQTLNLINSGTANFQLFNTASTCALNAQTSSVAFTSGTYAAEYYVKLRSTNFSAGDRVEVLMGYTGFGTAGGTTSSPKAPYINIYASADLQSSQLNQQSNTLNIDNIGFASAMPKLGIPNVANACYPLPIYINNKLGATIANLPSRIDFKFLLKDLTTLENFEKTSLRYQVVDLDKNGVTGGYSLKFAGDFSMANPCQYLDLIPIGTSGTLTGSVAPGTYVNTHSGTAYQIFIKTLGDGNFGRRRIQLYYGGTSNTTTIGYPVGQVDFELTTPD